MKKNILAIGALLVIVLTACAQQKKNTSSTTTQTTISNKQAKQLNYVGMERTACFGRCPAYLIELYPDGLVRYTSRNFTEYEGVYEKNIGAQKTQEIITDFKNYRVDTCRNNYEAYIQDLPGIIYTFKFGTTEKRITHADFGPGYLKTMADKIDKIGLPDKSWKKTGEVKQPK
ncbi:DUF6438 domain-containing protein [Polluticoccus soli]|uniref:DUF6438 domain-containing protein n=1 Tax=Polluticoccus soli TaxID=3034150 RepID=UPI0023E280D3|nr:DUF6438 domain-containing protein [Flavipsychrobacter sp. JY13-12]